MDLQTTLLIIGIVMLSIIMLILVAAAVAIMMIRRKILLFGVSRLDSVIGLLPIAKFLFSRRSHMKR